MKTTEDASSRTVVPRTETALFRPLAILESAWSITDHISGTQRCVPGKGGEAPPPLLGTHNACNRQVVCTPMPALGAEQEGRRGSSGREGGCGMIRLLLMIMNDMVQQGTPVLVPARAGNTVTLRSSGLGVGSPLG